MPSDPEPEWVFTRRQAIGGRIRDARERANLTQEQLGERIDLDHKTIHRIEYAISDPPLSTLIRLAAELHVTIADLEGPPPNTQAAKPD